MKLKFKRINFKSKKVIVPALVVLVLLIISVIFLSIKNKESEYTENSYARTVRQILNLATEPSSDEDEVYVADNEGVPKYKLAVNKKNNVIIVYQKNKDGEFKEAFKSMTCSVGRDVPTGEYKTGDRYIWKIVNGNVWAQYTTRLDGVIMFQSVPFEQKSKDSLIVKYYNQLGFNCNAFAIRLNVADAKWIVENCPEGTKVEVFEDEQIGPLGKPNVIALTSEDKWDPSDPDPANPGNSNKLVLEGVEGRTIERGIAVDYLSGVRVINDYGEELSAAIDVDSKVDIFKCGDYEVVYSVKDSTGANVSKTVVFKVVDTLRPVFSGLPSKISVNDSVSLDKNFLLKGVFVVDNNQFLSTDKISVNIPSAINDGDFITFSATDDYGNTTTMQVVCVIDTTPPTINVRSGVKNIIDISQVVDEEYAISRVIAMDGDTELSREHISVNISQNEWGYTFNYIATDDSGLTATLQNTVTYPTYTIQLPETEFVDDLTDISLLNGVALLDSLGNVTSAQGVTVSSAISTDNTYLVEYTYEYSSPLGTRKASAQRKVKLQVVEEIPGEDDNEPDAVLPTVGPDTYTN